MRGLYVKFDVAGVEAATPGTLSQNFELEKALPLNGFCIRL